MLSDFAAADRAEVGVTTELAADAVTDVVTHGLLSAQNDWNAR